METLSFVGSLGKASSFRERVIEAVIAPSSGPAQRIIHETFEIRKDALDGADDTPLPISVTLGTLVDVRGIVILVSNSALVRIDAEPDLGAGPVAMPEYHLMGKQNDQPEGLYVFFGQKRVTAIEIEDVFADQTIVEVWVAGNPE